MIEPKLTWSEIKHIDDSKIWKVLTRASLSGLLVMMSRAMKVVPASALESVFHGYAWPHDIGDAEPPPQKPLLEAVQEFVVAARRGDYYEEYDEDWTKDTKSAGTHQIDALFDIHFERCIAETETGDPKEVCAAYDLLFDLLRHIDECHDDVVFWPDEPGIWQFGIQWVRVLPPYLRCLRQVLGEDEFEERAKAIVEEFEPAGAEKVWRAVREPQA